MFKSKRNEKLKFVKLFLIESHVVFLVLIKLESLNKRMITYQKKFTSLEYRNKQHKYCNKTKKLTSKLSFTKKNQSSTRT